MSSPKLSRVHAAPAGRETAKPRRREPAAGDAQVLGVAVSSPGKALWPDGGDGRPVTKLDLARYFEAVGPWMLEHVEGRPCSIVRAPEGIGRQIFFQRHPLRGGPDAVSTVKLAGQRRPFLAVDRLEGLVALAQIAALELHPGNGLPGEPEVPGRLVFDLDPAPDLRFAAVVEAARELRERLERLGLAAFCKTTGGKGLHVVVPLACGRGPAPGWLEARSFARTLCEQMAADSPRRYLIDMARRARAGRIFLDYLRNDRLATAVAPLSPRARPGATVSMPLEWARLRGDLDPRRFTVRSAPALLARSRAWSDYDRSARPLAPALRRVGGGEAIAGTRRAVHAAHPDRREP